MQSILTRSILPIFTTLLLVLTSIGCSRETTKQEVLGKPSGDKADVKTEVVEKRQQDPENQPKDNPKEIPADRSALRDTLRGKWVGDREAYQKANPGDSTGDAVNAFLEYVFTDTTMQFGTAFELSKKEVSYQIIHEEKDRVKIRIQPGDDNQQHAWITFVDKDHLRLIWEPMPDSDKQACLKRAKE